jgi:hypothetical protein
MSWWDDEEPRTRTRERADVIDADDEIGIAGAALTARRPPEDLAPLVALVRAAGPRDIDAITKEAIAVGTRLGAILPTDPDNHGTGAYYRWWAKNQDGTRSVIEGPTVGLMQELGGIWGAMGIDVWVMRQTRTEIELGTRILDLHRLWKIEVPYPGWLRPPPARFKGDELGRWVAMQVASAESRAIRAALVRVIPQSVQDAAFEAAEDSAAKARLGGRNLNDATKLAIDKIAGLPAFRPQDRDELLAQLARWFGRPPGAWLATDLGALRGIYRRVNNGELTLDSLRVEAAERESARRQAETGEQPEGTAQPDDRLRGFGVDPAPNVNTGSAAPTPGRDETPGAAPSGTSGGSAPGPASASGAAEDPDAAERARLVAEIGELAGKVPKTVSDALRADHGLQAIRQNANVKKLASLAGDLRAAVAKHAERMAGIADARWNGPTDPAELVAAIGDLARNLGPGATTRAVVGAGLASAEAFRPSTPTPQLRLALMILLEQVPAGGEGG